MYTAFCTKGPLVSLGSGKKERNLNGRRILLVADTKSKVMLGKQILEKANLVVDVAYVCIAVKRKIEQSGINGFVFKPFDPEDHYNSIEEVMDVPLAA